MFKTKPMSQYSLILEREPWSSRRYCYYSMNELYVLLAFLPYNRNNCFLQEAFPFFFLAVDVEPCCLGIVILTLHGCKTGLTIRHSPWSVQHYIW